MGVGDLGFGFAKMMEGVSGGVLAGENTLYQRGLYDQASKLKQDELARKQAHDEADLYIKDQTNQINAAKIISDQEQAKFHKSLSSFTAALSIAKDSMDPNSAFKTAYGHLNPDGDPLNVDIKGGTISVTWPGHENLPGYEVNGPRDNVSKAVELINKNPQDIKAISEAAIANGVSIKPYYSPSWVAKHGEKKSPDSSLEMNRTLSRYISGIKIFGSKYSTDAGGGITVDESGNMKFDPVAFNAGRMTAYSAMKKIIAESKDPNEVAEAKHDLALVQGLYGKIGSLMGGLPSSSRTIPAAANSSPPDNTVNIPGLGSGASFAKMVGGDSGSYMGPVKPDAVVPGFEKVPGPPVTWKNVQKTMDDLHMTQDQVLSALKKKWGIK